MTRTSARTSLTDLLASPPDIDRARILATTEAEIRAQAVADGDDPDAEAEGYRWFRLPTTCGGPWA
ncbi:hypothetical protein MKK55_27415 [Methylobacterium sp. J-059]|uniref:hypothetical protein n=1 Tax=Methylobacterium sp. J-059 TaxID=2836643 RepID=UPI001FB9D137|nr:hypothetical protein [Methylobacterium sp. J-059]MCJ2042648.1 hypothetical protein [Methylobacterium sp. J-059]